MGQQQSSNNVRRPRLRRRGTRSIHHISNSSGSSYEDDDGGFQVLGDDEDDILDEKIRLYRQELKTLIADGVAEKHQRQYELNQLDNELYEKKLALHQLGEESKTFYSFWDYVSIVQSTPYPQQQQKEKEGERNTNPSSSKEERRKRRKKKKSLPSSSSASTQSTPSTTNAACPSSNSKASSVTSQSTAVMAFTIFGFFEAYLVRRLHLALLLQHQCSMQKKGWNEIIVSCYDEFPTNKRMAKRAKLLLEYVLSHIVPSYEDELIETVERLLFLQDKLIFRLRHGEERLSGFDYSGGYPVIIPNSDSKSASCRRIGGGEQETDESDDPRRISEQPMVVEAEYGSSTNDDGGHSKDDGVKQNNTNPENESMKQEGGENKDDDVSNVINHRTEEIERSVVDELDSDNDDDDGSKSDFDESDNDDIAIVNNRLEQVSNSADKSSTNDHDHGNDEHGSDDHHGDDVVVHTNSTNRNGNRRGLFGRLRRRPSDKLMQ
eukprot:scaffold4663_cov109-Cylindrotheca_fusiformis.AAC.9